jgi:Tfp pilus assembly protein FimT
MKNIKTILLLGFLGLVVNSSYGQFISFTTPPNSGNDAPDIFINNGRLNLNDLNPVMIAQEKYRRRIDQEWSNTRSRWQTSTIDNYRHGSSCNPLLSISTSEVDSLTGVSTQNFLDSLIYTNNRLTRRLNFSVEQGVRELLTTTTYTYSGSRMVPDTILHIFSFTGFEDTSRIIYGYNNANQLVSILRQTRLEGVFRPLVRVNLTYDTQGNLTQYNLERYRNNAFVPELSINYSYNAQNQLRLLRTVEWQTTSVDTIQEVYTYNAQNQIATFKFSSYRNNTWEDELEGRVVGRNSKNRPLSLLAKVGFNLFFDSIRVNFTYTAGDTTLRQYIGQTKLEGSTNWENSNRVIWEYCGEPVAVEEPAKQNLAFTVYPNPATDALSIKLRGTEKEIFDVQILNLAGQVLQKRLNVPTDTPLSISELPAGLYILKLQSADKVGVKTFSVIR